MARGPVAVYVLGRLGQRSGPSSLGPPAALQAGDTQVFWKSDRWGRSAAHVLTTISELGDRGVTVESLTENFDLDTKEGRFMFAVLAAAAEYQLELHAERQAEGIAAARPTAGCCPARSTLAVRR